MSKLFAGKKVMLKIFSLNLLVFLFNLNFCFATTYDTDKINVTNNNLAIQWNDTTNHTISIANTNATGIANLTIEGNVGIGVTNPSRRLHVAGTDGMRINPSATPGSVSAGDIIIDSSDSNILKWYNGSSWQSAGGGAVGGGWTDDGTAVRLTTITDNVGIGTTNPVYTLQVNGSLAAKYKNFVIPHPLDPKNKVLVHSSLEGPEHAVYYRGEEHLVNGERIIYLPSYFEALTLKDNRTVQLTAVEGYSPLYAVNGVKDGKFTVRTTELGNQSQRFYWEVKAIRSDIPLLVPEREK